MTSIESEKINVILTRIVSPTEFWIKIQSNDDSHESCPHSDADIDKQRTHRDYLQRIKDQAEWKCHLAFLVPIDCICWSLTAIDQFKRYARQFIEFAISLPQTVDTSTRSTAVILWGLTRDKNDANHSNDHDTHHSFVWRNINLQMIFQGVARSLVHIEDLNSGLPMPRPNEGHAIIEQQQQHQLKQGDGSTCHGKMPRKTKKRWLPALTCRDKEFTGTPVFVDDKLVIYVQEWEHRKCIEQISNVLTAWHQKLVAKNPSKFWQKGDMCVARRSSDGMYHRAEIRQVKARQKCLIQWVDFGYTEKVRFNHLSTHIDFADIPIQVRKCHLSNIIHISDEHTQEARKLCTQLICNQLCGIYIRDNVDVEHNDSIACSIQSLNIPLDLSSLLISRGLVQHRAHSDREFGIIALGSERTRKGSDEPIMKNSAELHSYEDFREFYRTHKAKNPICESNDSCDANDDIKGVDDDNGSRIFEIFAAPTKRTTLDENIHGERTTVVASGSHPIVECITAHFKLSTIRKPVFDCRCVLIVDPVTILIETPDVKPLLIDHVEKQTKYFPLQEKSPIIAYANYTWRRGIVWEKLSTNFYLILFVDTLKISEVHRKLIQACPTELLGTPVPFAKVRLGQIEPNKRMRALDICSQLDPIIMNRFLLAYAVTSHENGVPEIKLYESESAKRPIYNSLIKQKFYKKNPKTHSSSE